MTVIFLLSLQEVLDADDTPLVNQRGVKMSRDIVQFVPLRNFQSRNGTNFSLSKETLAEIPNQLTSFMKSKGIKPNPPPLRRHETFSQGMPSGMFLLLDTNHTYIYIHNQSPLLSLLSSSIFYCSPSTTPSCATKWTIFLLSKPAKFESEHSRAILSSASAGISSKFF